MKIIVAAILAATAFASPCMAQEQVGSGPWLVDALRRITDEGALFDPARVGNLLHIRFEGEPARPPLDPIVSCRGELGVRDGVVLWHNAEPEWIMTKAESGGAAAAPDHKSAPPPAPARSPFHYTEAIEGPCNDFRIAGTRSAILAMTGLPTFACVQRSELERLPGFGVAFMMHGIRALIYRKPENDQRAAELMFFFGWDKPCAGSVTIRQGPRWGHRYQRAEARWRTCRDEAGRRYCAAHGLVALDDEGAQDAMEEAVSGVCGSMTSAYDSEPIAGPAPPVKISRDLVPGSLCPKP